MRTERALVGEIRSDGRIDYVRISRLRYDPGTDAAQPPQALQLGGDDDSRARALSAYGDLCTLGALEMNRPCNTSHCEWLKREPRARVNDEASYLAEARVAGAHVAALHGNGAWRVWLIPPEEASSAVTGALDALDTACDEVDRGVAGFEMSLRRNPREATELRREARSQLRAAGREIRQAFERVRGLSEHWTRHAINSGLGLYSAAATRSNRPVLEALQVARNFAAETHQGAGSAACLPRTG